MSGKSAITAYGFTPTTIEVINGKLVCNQTLGEGRSSSMLSYTIVHTYLSSSPGTMRKVMELGLVLTTVGIQEVVATGKTPPLEAKIEAGTLDQVHTIGLHAVDNL